MADVQEFEQPMDGVEEGVEESTAPPTADQEQDGQPTDKAERKVNLDELVEFREWKRSADQRLAQTEQRYQQMLQQQAQELRNRQMSEMDDYQRLEYERDEALQRAQYSDQMAEQMRSEQRKFQQLSQVAKEAKVPLDYLMENTESPDDIWRVVTQYQRQSEQRRAAEAGAAAAAKAAARQDKQARNTVNTGTGAATTPNAWGEKFSGARTSQDLAKLFWQQEQ